MYTLLGLTLECILVSQRSNTKRLCSAGQEITISYGQHPDEVFYLFYGFLPENNPANLVTLFSARDDFEAYASNEGLKRCRANDLFPSVPVRCSTY